MAKKYHISDNGTPAECVADVRACTKGGGFHGSFEEVLQESERRLEEAHGLIKTMKKERGLDTENNEVVEAKPFVQAYDNPTNEHQRSMNKIYNDQASRKWRPSFSGDLYVRNWSNNEIERVKKIASDLTSRANEGVVHGRSEEKIMDALYAARDGEQKDSFRGRYYGETIFHPEITIKEIKKARRMLSRDMGDRASGNSFLTTLDRAVEDLENIKGKPNKLKKNQPVSYVDDRTGELKHGKFITHETIKVDGRKINKSVIEDESGKQATFYANEVYPKVYERAGGRESNTILKTPEKGEVVNIKHNGRWVAGRVSGVRKFRGKPVYDVNVSSGYFSTSTSKPDEIKVRDRRSVSARTLSEGGRDYLDNLPDNKEDFKKVTETWDAQDFSDYEDHAVSTSNMSPVDFYFEDPERGKELLDKMKERVEWAKEERARRGF